MPFINVKVLAGAFSPAQKSAMIDDITNVMTRIGGDGIRPAVHVLVEEVPSGMWGIGGAKLTSEEIEERRAARARTEG